MPESDGFPNSKIVLRELSGSKFIQLMENRKLFCITRFVLVPLPTATDIMGGESDADEQLLTGIAATSF